MREDTQPLPRGLPRRRAPAGGGNEGQARLARAVHSMASSVSDCHTAFTDPQQAEEQAARLRGDVRFGGVGIRTSSVGAASRS